MPDFSYASTAKSVHDSLSDAFASVPDGHKGALLVVADQDGARVLVAERLGANWQIAAGAGKLWKGPVTGQVSLLGSW